MQLGIINENGMPEISSLDALDWEREQEILASDEANVDPEDWESDSWERAFGI